MFSFSFQGYCYFSCSTSSWYPPSTFNPGTNNVQECQNRSCSIQTRHWKKKEPWNRWTPVVDPCFSIPFIPYPWIWFDGTLNLIYGFNKEWTVISYSSHTRCVSSSWFQGLIRLTRLQLKGFRHCSRVLQQTTVRIWRQKVPDIKQGCHSIEVYPYASMAFFEFGSWPTR